MLHVYVQALCILSAGKLNSQGQNLLIYGRQFGNVFIGVQPTFGYEGDPMALLFSRSASPHHGFAAYYTYLESIFKVSLLHFLYFIPACLIHSNCKYGEAVCQHAQFTAIFNIVRLYKDIHNARAILNT